MGLDKIACIQGLQCVKFLFLNPQRELIWVDLLSTYKIVKPSNSVESVHIWYIHGQNHFNSPEWWLTESESIRASQTHFFKSWSGHGKNWILNRPGPEDWKLWTHAQVKTGKLCTYLVVLLWAHTLYLLQTNQRYIYRSSGDPTGEFPIQCPIMEKRRMDRRICRTTVGWTAFHLRKHYGQRCHPEIWIRQAHLLGAKHAISGVFCLPIELRVLAGVTLPVNVGWKM